MPEFAPVLNVNSLDGSNGYRLNGHDPSARTGLSLSLAGDINGDGLSDIIIGASYDGASGRSYLVFGATSNSAVADLNALIAAGKAYSFVGEGAGDHAGFSVSAAGDVNGDGFDDIFIGTYSADPDSPGGNRGASYLVFGGPAKLEMADAADGTNDNIVSLATLTPATGFRFDGIADGDHAGFRVSNAGDIDGDGKGDLMISSTFTNSNAGSTWIVFGGLANLNDLDNDDGIADGRIDLSNLSAGKGMRIDGEAVGDQSGIGLAAAGDVNGDGYGDVIIGAGFHQADFAGAVYIMFGGPRATLPANVDLTSPAGFDFVRIEGASADERAGFSVAGAGDVNGDGFADVIIGAPYNSSSRGSAYVVFGQSVFGNTLSLSDLDGTNGFRLDGVRTADMTGFRVSGAGDVNGDGYRDILVAAPLFDSGRDSADSGGAFVIFGGREGFAPVINLGTLDGDNGFRIDISEADAFGGGVSGAGDINGDGFDDIVFGADGADNGTSADAGATFVIFGHRALTDVVRLGTSLDNRINGGTGDDLIKGFGGKDTLLGWEGDDTVWGGSGNDTVIVAAGDDELHGGSGRDTLSFEKFSDPITVNLATGNFALPNSDIQAFFSFENVLGGSDKDTITGDAKANELDGAGGKDTITAGAGDDTLIGGAGADRLNGEAGLDHFIYKALADSGITATTRDTISAFGDGQDKIDVSVIDAKVGVAHNQAFTFDNSFGIGDIRSTQQGSDTLLEFNTDGDTFAEMSILLANFTATNITGTDFIL